MCRVLGAVFVQKRCPFFVLLKLFATLQTVNPRLLTLKPVIMTVWIVMIGVVVLAFGIRAGVKLCHRKRNVGYHPDISTKKRLKRFVNRFRHLEGVGD